MSLDPLRQAARALIHDRAVTLLSVLLLATTIGAVTAVFAIVDAVLLRPLPFADQERIVIAWQRDDRRAVPLLEITYGQMQDWAARSRTVSPLAVVAATNWNVGLVERSGAVPIDIAAVSSSFFRVVGTPPALGRALDASDDQATPPAAMVISDGLWTRRFGREPGIVGRIVSVKLDTDGAPVPIRVAGVMPAAFDYPRGAEAWLPAAPLVRRYGAAFHLDAEASVHALGVFYAIGRVRDGIGLEQAAAELTRVMRTAERPAGVEPAERIVLTRIADHLIGPAGPVLRTLLAGGLLMLLIACANVASLQVSRAARRERALAIQAALGASHGRLAGVVVAESVMLTAAALAGACLLGWLTLHGLIWLAPAGVFRLDQAALLDARVLAFAALVTFATVSLCALWPVRVTRRVDAIAVLADGSQRVTNRRGRRLQRAIVVGQVAVALTLLAGTGLFLRTVRGLNATVLGFDPEQLLAFTVSPSTDDVTKWNAIYDAALRRLQASPGVVAAGGVLIRPLSGPIGMDMQPRYPGQLPTDVRTSLNPHVNLEAVTPGYFRAMGIALRSGRPFDDRDTLTAPGAVVVSESTARRLWPGQAAIGQRLAEPTWRGRAPSGQPDRWQTVVGVVADVRYRGLTDVRLDLYVPAAQSESRVQQLMVRTSGDTASAVAAVRAAVGEADPATTVSDATAMRDVVAAESAPWRFLTQVFVAFASLAALLATIGLGAVVALDVTARRRELAIRAALGAEAGRLRWLVLRQAIGLTGIGLLLGLIGAIGLGRGVSAVLIGVRPDDPATLVAVAAAAAGACLVAAWVPASRAGRADPLAALRAE